MLTRRWGATLCLVLASAGLASPASAMSDHPSSQPDRAHPAAAGWSIFTTHPSEVFHAVAAVSSFNAWLSSDSGLVLTTRDRGATWQDVSPPQAKGLMLRDIEAPRGDMRDAAVLAVGLGNRSRVFVTDDGGTSWTRTFTNHNPHALYDCMAIGFDGGGLALSDPVKGTFRLISTADGGHTWSRLDPTQMPRALHGESAFAESGSCLVRTGTSDYLFGTAGPHPRVFSTADSGHTWTVARTPIQGGDTAGIYGLAADDTGHVVAVGGDASQPSQGARAAAISADGGATWALGKKPVFGLRSGVAWASYRTLAVGPTGSDISLNNGSTWTHYDDTPFNAVSCADRGACWAVGPNGTVGEWTYVH